MCVFFGGGEGRGPRLLFSGFIGFMLVWLGQCVEETSFGEGRPPFSPFLGLGAETCFSWQARDLDILVGRIHSGSEFQGYGKT